MRIVDTPIQTGTENGPSEDTGLDRKQEPAKILPSLVCPLLRGVRWLLFEATG